MNFTEKTNCTDCPCLNADYEYGAGCNLGYGVSTEWDKDKNQIYCSSVCGLEIVKFKGGEFVPNDRRMVVGVHPNQWDS